MPMCLLKMLLKPSHQGAGNGAHGDPETCMYPRQFITGHKGMCSFGHAAEQQNKRDTQIEEARWGAHGHGPGEALKSRPGEAQTNTTIR